MEQVDTYVTDCHSQVAFSRLLYWTSTYMILTKKQCPSIKLCGMELFKFLLRFHLQHVSQLNAGSLLSSAKYLIFIPVLLNAGEYFNSLFKLSPLKLHTTVRSQIQSTDDDNILQF